MRDLHTYPITKTEIITCLNELAEELNATSPPGNMQPMLLRAAARLIDSRVEEK